jgi:hypothetical protein
MAASPPRPVDAPLRAAAVVFAAGLAVHTADHVRRGLDVITAEVLWGGNVLTVLAVIAIAMVFLRHRSAALVCAVVGFTAAVGVSASHLLPHWSALSDSLPDGNVDAFTWFAVLLEIVGALALGAAGLHALQHDRDEAVASLR